MAKVRQAVTGGNAHIDEHAKTNLVSGRALRRLKKNKPHLLDGQVLEQTSRGNLIWKELFQETIGQMLIDLFKCGIILAVVSLVIGALAQII